MKLASIGMILALGTWLGCTEGQPPAPSETTAATRPAPRLLRRPLGPFTHKPVGLMPAQPSASAVGDASDAGPPASATTAAP